MRLLRIVAVIAAWLLTLATPAFGQVLDCSDDRPAEPALFVWVRDAQPTVNPANRPALAARAGSDNAGQQPNEFALVKSVARSATSLTYREVNTNTAPCMVKRGASEYRLTWSPPAKVVQPGEKMRLTVRLTGASSSDGREDGVPWQIVSPLELAVANASAKLSYHFGNFNKPQILELPMPRASASSDAPTVTISLRSTGGDDLPSGTIVTWSYRLQRVTAEEVVAMTDLGEE